ncbi:unnamed protein product [Protopolystoma xenopodis]|uniref:Uncharacterized protein n=1 Tax=Protopolystoma xenopodis TaxID=117903 RepID=A0A3S4ZU53_9PLAT|nr:unnamed protein product [Protopolystoma xenopodis]
MLTTMPTKRLEMYHVNGPTLEMIMQTMDSGLVRSSKSSNQYDHVAKTRSNNLYEAYGLSKEHKEGKPLRPIVNDKDGQTAKLAKSICFKFKKVNERTHINFDKETKAPVWRETNF